MSRRKHICINYDNQDLVSDTVESARGANLWLKSTKQTVLQGGSYSIRIPKSGERHVVLRGVYQGKTDDILTFGTPGKSFAWEIKLNAISEKLERESAKELMDRLLPVIVRLDETAQDSESKERKPPAKTNLEDHDKKYEGVEHYGAFS